MEEPMEHHLIREFKQSWGFLRSMTMDFIRAVPDDKWNFSPHPKFGTFARQIKHLVRVQGAYNKGFTDQKLDIREEHYSFYSGDSSRAALIEALIEKDQELTNVLQSIEGAEIESFKLELLPMNISLGFSEYCHIILQHEALHHGEWSLYAAFGGFQAPRSWKENWDI